MSSVTESSIRDEAHYRVLRVLKATPDISQRELADELGISLGKVNYLLRGLIDKGLVKASNFQKSRNKLGYVYQLTPAGIEHKAKVTLRYLQRRMDEYEALREELRLLRRDLESPSGTSES
jgi:MarR family transcriptional regulator, temperature-dependent positive regulator of motility